jgi:hypothetical protein
LRKILIRTLLVALWIAIALAAWITTDLYRPVKVNICSFDPDEVARLDTAMWRSYYSRERVRLFREATELLEKQYHLSFWRRQLVAYHAAKSAFVFKDGKSREDYEKALPDLRKFYSEIRDISTTEFDVDQAARLELEWWIVHRERARHGPNDLVRALADAASAVYNVPADRLMEYGDLRAKAMEIRDNQAEAGSVSEEDWERIDDLLHGSWRSLHAAVNNQ